MSAQSDGNNTVQPQGCGARIKPLINRHGKYEAESPNTTFCMAPFTHTYISPQSERRMCCASREEASFIRQYIDGGTGQNTHDGYNPTTLDEHWNSEHMRRVRLDLLEGKRIPECEVCNDKILNVDVYRNWFNLLFRDKLDDVIAATDETGHLSRPAISFDYRINNLCSFKCRMCGQQLSSSWEAENRRFDEWSRVHEPWMIPEVKQVIEKFQTSVVEAELETACKDGTVEELYWVGGEPLMWETHWRLMEHMVQSRHSKDVFARYNTNLSRVEWNGSHLFRDILPHYRDYLMCCSIDGTGKIGEFIRTGLVWDEWLANFRAGLEVPNRRDRMKIDLTLTLPGLFDLKNLFDLANELQVNVLTKIVYAFTPDKMMSPFALPRSVLDAMLDDLLAYMEPKTSHLTEGLVATLRDMKKRPTFAEQWPDQHEAGFRKGREFMRRLAHRRSDGTNGRLTIEDIFSANTDVMNWWMRN